MSRIGRRIEFRRVPSDALLDDPVVRSLRRHGAELAPDPLFERRLRGIVMNRHVAVREGYAVPQRRHSMTPIGRGVLLSSVLLAMGVTTAGAASQSALPGDPLYSVKLQIEGLRLAIAPADLRDELLAAALEERADELSTAAQAGRWQAAEEAAWRLATAEAELLATDGLTPSVANRINAHLAALDRVMVHAPPSAAAIVADRLDPARDALGGRGGGPPEEPPTASPAPAASPATGAAPSQAPDPATPRPSRSPRPSASPSPQPASHAPVGSGSSDASSR